MIASLADEVGQAPIAPLSWVADLVRGVSYPKSDASERSLPGFVPVLRATNIQGATLVLDSDLVFVAERNVSPEQLLRPGDIVVATSSGSKHLVGKSGQLRANWRGSFGAFCAAVRPRSGIHPRYLALFLQSPAYRRQIAKKALGVNINNLRRGDLESLELPLPPLNVQESIVAEIEKQISRLDKAVANLNRAKANLKRHKASVLKAAIEGRLVPTEFELASRTGRSFETATQLLERLGQVGEHRERHRTRGKSATLPNVSDLPPLPEGWCWADFATLSKRVTVGHVGPMKSEYASNGIPFLRSQNVRPNRYEPTGLMYVSPSFHQQLSKSALKPGDIVVVRSGSVGVSCVIPDSLPEANCSDLVIIKAPRGVLPTFGAYYLNAVVESRIAAGRVGVALSHFNTQAVADLPVPVPPIEEQSRIAAETSRRLSLADAMEVALMNCVARAEKLRGAVLGQAFCIY